METENRLQSHWSEIDEALQRLETYFDGEHGPGWVERTGNGAEAW
jgi:hypothetical protein